jgi:phospholipid/cholesterol/gamma-HCH transport system substrate-binding protein
MEYKSLEVRVGATIFIAAVVLSVGLMWFQGFQLQRKTYEISAVFPMVGGIDHGDRVNVNGVERGEVKRVVLRDRDVFITMQINADVKIPDDSRVILQSIGIMGERVVGIILGESATYVEPGAVLDGVYDPGISEALASLGKVMDRVQDLTKDLQQITGALTEGENLKAAIENLVTVTEELKAVVQQNSPVLEEGIASFNSSAKKMDDVLGRNSTRLDSIMVSLEEASGDLPELFDSLEELTAAMTRITKRLESDDNTMGALLEDRQLLDSLQQAITNLDLLITDIRANPKKYIKVSVF